MNALIVIGLALLALASFLRSREWLHEYILARQVSKQIVGLRRKTIEGSREALVNFLGYAMLGVAFVAVAFIFYTYG